MLTDAFTTPREDVMQMISALNAQAVVSLLAKAKHSALPFAKAINKQMDLKNGAY